MGNSHSLPEELYQSHCTVVRIIPRADPNLCISLSLESAAKLENAKLWLTPKSNSTTSNVMIPSNELFVTQVIEAEKTIAIFPLAAFTGPSQSRTAIRIDPHPKGVYLSSFDASANALSVAQHDESQSNNFAQKHFHIFPKPHQDRQMCAQLETRGLIVCKNDDVVNSKTKTVCSSFFFEIIERRQAIQAIHHPLQSERDVHFPQDGEIVGFSLAGRPDSYLTVQNGRTSAGTETSFAMAKAAGTDAQRKFKVRYSDSFGLVLAFSPLSSPNRSIDRTNNNYNPQHLYNSTDALGNGNINQQFKLILVNSPGHRQEVRIVRSAEPNVAWEIDANSNLLRIGNKSSNPKDANFELQRFTLVRESQMPKPPPPPSSPLADGQIVLIIPKSNSSVCLEASGAHNGAKLNFTKNASSPSQQFKINIRPQDKKFLFCPLSCRTRAVDTTGGRGGHQHMWDMSHGNNNQVFSCEYAGAEHDDKDGHRYFRITWQGNFDWECTGSNQLLTRERNSNNKGQLFRFAAPDLTAQKRADKIIADIIERRNENNDSNKSGGLSTVTLDAIAELNQQNTFSHLASASSSSSLPQFAEFKKAYELISLAPYWQKQSRLNHFTEAFSASSVKLDDVSLMINKTSDRPQDPIKDGSIFDYEGSVTELLLKIAAAGSDTKLSPAAARSFKDPMTGHCIYDQLKGLYQFASSAPKKKALVVALRILSDLGTSDELGALMSQIVDRAYRCESAKQHGLDATIVAAGRLLENRAAIQKRNKMEQENTTNATAAASANNNSLSLLDSHIRFFEIFSDFLDDHKSRSFSSAFIEPARFFYDCKRDQSGVDHVEVHAINWYLVQAQSLGIGLPQSFADDGCLMAFDHFWNGFSHRGGKKQQDAHVWEVFSNPRNFGSRFEGMRKQLHAKGQVTVQTMNYRPTVPSQSYWAEFTKQQTSGSAHQKRKDFDQTVERFAYFFSHNFMVKKMLETLNSEIKAEHSGFRKVCAILFEEFLRRKLDIALCPKLKKMDEDEKKSKITQQMLDEFIAKKEKQDAAHKDQFMSEMGGCMLSSDSLMNEDNENGKHNSKNNNIAIYKIVRYEDFDEFCYNDDYYTDLNVDRVAMFFAWLGITKPVTTAIDPKNNFVNTEEGTKCVLRWQQKDTTTVTQQFPRFEDEHPVDSDNNEIDGTSLASLKETSSSFHNHHSGMFYLESSEMTREGQNPLLIDNNENDDDDDINNKNINDAGMLLLHRPENNNNNNPKPLSATALKPAPPRPGNGGGGAVLIECPICLEMKSDVKVLPHSDAKHIGDISDHRLCGACFKDLQDTQYNVQCPFCRESLVCEEFLLVAKQFSAALSKVNVKDGGAGHDVHAAAALFETWQMIELEHSGTHNKVLRRIALVLLKDPRVGGVIAKGVEKKAEFLRDIAAIIFRFYALLREDQTSTALLQGGAAAASAVAPPTPSNLHNNTTSPTLDRQALTRITQMLEQAVDIILTPFERNENHAVMGLDPHFYGSLYSQALAALLSAQSSGSPCGIQIQLTKRTSIALASAYDHASSNKGRQNELKRRAKDHLVLEYFRACQPLLNWDGGKDPFEKVYMYM